MKEKDNQTNLKKLIDRAGLWIASEKGQQAIRDAFQRAVDESERLEEAQKIKIESLLEPVTI